MLKNKLVELLRLRTRPPVEDIELGQLPANPQQKQFINGFPSAADFVARDPDNSFSIYRSFNRLSARNLLYLEVELLELQRQQDLMNAVDNRGNPNTLRCFRSWRKLNESTDQSQAQ